MIVCGFLPKRIRRVVRLISGIVFLSELGTRLRTVEKTGDARDKQSLHHINRFINVFAIVKHIPTYVVPSMCIPVLGVFLKSFSNPKLSHPFVNIHWGRPAVEDVDALTGRNRRLLPFALDPVGAILPFNHVEQFSSLPELSIIGDERV